MYTLGSSEEEVNRDAMYRDIISAHHHIGWGGPAIPIYAWDDKGSREE